MVRLGSNEGWGFRASGSAQSFKLMVWDLIIFSQGFSSMNQAVRFIGLHQILSFSVTVLHFEKF